MEGNFLTLGFLFFNALHLAISCDSPTILQSIFLQFKLYDFFFVHIPKLEELILWKWLYYKN